MLKLTDFDFNLPKELIAQFPVKPRSSSRLLVLNREKRTLEHKHFFDLCDYIKTSETIVLNDTKVYPARLFGINKRNNKKIEFLLLKEIKESVFECLTKPTRQIEEGDCIIFDGGSLKAEVLSKGKFVNIRILSISSSNRLKEVIEELAEVPLPPYIKREVVATQDKEDYQTVYAKKEGAVAAPTAGLHFTKDLLKKVKLSNINVAYLTLHAGYGTFAPVREKDFRQHEMHKEYFSISKECVDLVNRAREDKKRVIAVGTTTARALETAVCNSKIKEIEADTDLFIYPPYNFKIVNALITNFHLPKTTLLMLVAAFCQGSSKDPHSGLDFLLRAYNEAVKKGYRFYSYGDAMLII